jgi:hypothetical protein
MPDPIGPPPAFPIIPFSFTNNDNKINSDQGILICELLKRVDLLEKEIKLLKILINKKIE